MSSSRSTSTSSNLEKIYLVLKRLRRPTLRKSRSISHQKRSVRLPGSCRDRGSMNLISDASVSREHIPIASIDSSSFYRNEAILMKRSGNRSRGPHYGIAPRREKKNLKIPALILFYRQAQMMTAKTSFIKKILKAHRRPSQLRESPNRDGSSASVNGEENENSAALISRDLESSLSPFEELPEWA